MSGGFGSWLFTGVAGLARAPGSRGWQALLFRPAAFVHAAVTSASASVATPIGLAAISWLQAPPTPTAMVWPPGNAVVVVPVLPEITEP